MAWDPPSEEVVGVPTRDGPSLFWPGVLTGIGLAGTLDEVVLHQVRAGAPNNLPYDLAFLALAATLALLLRQVRQPAS
jgi:hypothetical protein